MSTPSNLPFLTSSLERWFKDHARELPWRLEVRDPYHALVSELMLQQTQVSRVIEKYGPFIERFPTCQSLADAHEDDVLAMWAGLGYYRRARMLHACAKDIVDRFNGQVPSDVQELQSLPGVGRYTAGAIASMVFQQAEPIVDGNVVRVLMRLHNRQTPQTDKETVAWSWDLAEQLVHTSEHPEIFNEAMMELGATVCTPKNIRCPQCPWQSACSALKAGSTESVPFPKPRAKQKQLFCATIVHEHKNSVLIEQRPSPTTITGMWSGMYQLPTLEREKLSWTLDDVATHLGVGEHTLEELGMFTHITTHRIIEFKVFRAQTVKSSESNHYRTIDSLNELGFSNAQRRIMKLAQFDTEHVDELP